MEHYMDNTSTAPESNSPTEAVRSEPFDPFDKQMTKIFIRNVFLTLCGQLIITCVVTLLILTIESVKNALITKNDNSVWISALVFFWAFYTILVCCYGISRSVPINYIILLCLSITTAIIIAHWCVDENLEMYSLKVLISVGLLAVLCFVLAFIGYKIPFDLTPLLGILFVLLIALIILIILYMFGMGSQSKILYSIILGLGVILMALHFMVDVHIITNNRHRYSITSSDHVLAATLLYLDIFFFFVFFIKFTVTHWRS